MTYSNTSTSNINLSVPRYIRAYGTKFLTSPAIYSHGSKYAADELSEGKEELREIQKEAREYIKTAIDSRHAYNEIFAAVYEYALNLDSWAGTVYCEGEPVASPEDLTHRLAHILNRQPPNRAEFNLEYDRICRERAKNPVALYLEQLGNPKPITTRVMDEELGYTVPRTICPDPVTPETFPEFNELAKHCFGESATTLDNTLLTRWLISAVARAVKPGCKADSALVLKGEQGIGKTAFFQTLATIPNPLSRDQELTSYFGTLLPRKTVETQQEIQQLWIAEMGEVESTFRAKDISELKAFLTETADLYRAPYARTPQKHPRHTAICATTNQDSFLTDGTGSRRFWVIDLGTHPINLEWVTANREKIWACAYYLYTQGEQWWLTEDEAGLSENRVMQPTNPPQVMKMF